MAFLKNLKNQPIDGELAIALSKSYPLYKHGFVKVGEKKWFLPYKCAEQDNINKILNFEIRPDDTWIISYPRSGTTLTQELTWLVANDLNFDEARQRTLIERFPYLDLGLILEDDVLANDTPEEQKISKYSIEFVQNQPSPRFIKSHFPLDLLPTVVNNDCKIIYVARNVKSVAVSWYYFQKDLKLYEGTFEQMCDDFMNDHLMWTPYWEHVKTAWAIRHKPNVLFLFYEDLRKNLVENIKKIATFFGKTYNEVQIVKLAEHLNIENFRKNPMVNRHMPTQRGNPKVFIRQGKTDGWKELFTLELEKRFNKWIVDNLKDTDLIFPN
ncbi:sulfotransferase 1B1-like [Anoplolepis gracilipes]|uniref:sulfotransferase 1B1-like n=1 Tax=Anoplolepis gracilipes TaxID=354296 RepID=UPI003B9DC619